MCENTVHAPAHLKMENKKNPQRERTTERAAIGVAINPPWISKGLDHVSGDIPPIEVMALRSCWDTKPFSAHLCVATVRILAPKAVISFHPFSWADRRFPLLIQDIEERGYLSAVVWRAMFQVITRQLCFPIRFRGFLYTKCTRFAKEADGIVAGRCVICRLAEKLHLTRTLLVGFFRNRKAGIVHR